MVVVPFGWAFNKMFQEVKRIQILLNKTQMLINNLDVEYIEISNIRNHVSVLCKNIQGCINLISERIHEKLFYIIASEPKIVINSCCMFFFGDIDFLHVEKKELLFKMPFHTYLKCF